MNLHNPLKHILIVGGGTAGWMAAAYLNRMLRGLGCNVSVLESIKLETGGIGEATSPAFTKFLRALRIDETQFMQQCSATYRLGTRFCNWVEEGQEFWHPLGLCGGTINDIDLFHFWLKSKRAGREEVPYWSYSLQALLGERDKSPRPLRGSSPVMETGAFGYHLDPATCADFLRELATREDVNHLFDDVRKVALDESGAIQQLETKGGRTLSADLYLDCTGRGELIDQGLGNPWIDWSSVLLCDRSVILPLPRDSRVPPYTRLTALEAGWMWQMSLSDRVACGYVYSGAHLSDDAAARELIARASPARAAAAEPRFNTTRVGRRQTFWLKNCVALGPAAGNVEPLQATDSLLLTRALELLVQYFPDHALSPVLARVYNQRIAAQHDLVRDFLMLPYVLSRRAQQPFWRDSTHGAVPDSLQAALELHDENGTVAQEGAALFSEPGYHHLFAAADRLPHRPCAAADAVDFAQVIDVLGKMRAQNESWLAKLPPHCDVMEALHRPAV